MKDLFSPRLVYLAALVALGPVSGCGQKLPPLAPVSGKVTVDGQPLTAGQVTLIPDVIISKQETKIETQTPGVSIGQIDSTGAYKIVTNGKPGAPPGKYKVTVTPPMIPSSDSKSAPAGGFNRKYSKARETPLRIEVVPDAPPGKYDLKLSK